MRILLLCHSFNSLTQRLFVELGARLVVHRIGNAVPAELRHRLGPGQGSALSR